MVKHNEKNARIKRRYVQYLSKARRQSEASVDKALASIDRFEEFRLNDVPNRPNGLFEPEYVNVFGVPLSIVENVDDTGEPPPPPKPTTQVEVLSDRSTFEITWPNVLRVESVVRPALVIDWEKVGALPLDPASKPITAELAPALGGAADMSQVVEIDLEKLPDGFRLQRSIFVASRKAFADLKGTFKGAPDYLVLQLIRIVERFLNSDRLQIPSLFHSDPLRKRILISLNIDLIVQHLLAFIEEQNTESLEPVYDPTARNSG